MTIGFLNPCDAVESRITFPKIIQPKIDGVRGANLNGAFTARSMKPHANRHTRDLFSQPEYLGFDGELAAGERNDPDLCRATTSATSTQEGQPFILLHTFDYLTQDTIILSYQDRLRLMEERIYSLWNQSLAGYLRPITWTWVRDKDELEHYRELYLEEGFEGSILREPTAKYRSGRCSPVTQHALRLKEFIDFEIVVTDIEEGKKNYNEAQTNELGLQFRSTHQENMEPNGMVGAMWGNLLADVIYRRQKLFEKGQRVKVGAGAMTHFDRKRFFENQELLIGKYVTAKFFPKGIKDRPRFPNFKSLRSPVDMG